MHGQEISELAHNAKTDKKSFIELKDKVKDITNKVVRRYLGLTDREDLISMCYISLINSVRTFNKDKGLFEPHYMQRAYQEVKREIIRGSLIRVPEAIINLSRRMVPIHKDALYKAVVEGDKESLSMLALVYGTTVRQITKVSQIKNVVSEMGTFVVDSEDSKKDIRKQDMERSYAVETLIGAMAPLDETTKQIILLHTGLMNENPMPFTKIADNLKMGVDSVRKLYKKGIEYLRSDDIRETLQGLMYYV